MLIAFDSFSLWNVLTGFEKPVFYRNDSFADLKIVPKTIDEDLLIFQYSSTIIRQEIQTIIHHNLWFVVFFSYYGSFM